MIVPAVIELQQAPHLDYCTTLAHWRQGNAERLGLAGHNNAPNGHDAALALHMIGAPGECAGKLYLNPVKWNTRDRFRADLEDWIDVKARPQHWHDLIVQYNDDPAWAYVLALVHDLPRVHLIGWCWGYEAKQECFEADPTGERPAYFVSQDDPIMRDMRELYQEVRKRQAATGVAP